MIHETCRYFRHILIYRTDYIVRLFSSESTHLGISTNIFWVWRYVDREKKKLGRLKGGNREMKVDEY